MNSSRDHPNQTVFQSTQSLEFPVPSFPTAWIDIKRTFHWVLHRSHKHALPYTFPENENSIVDYIYVLFITLTWSVAISSAVTHGSILGSLLFVLVKRPKKNWLLPRVKWPLRYLMWQFSGLHVKLNELIEEEKSLRHVAMVVAKFLDLDNRGWYSKYGRKKRKIDTNDFPVHDCTQEKKP